MKVWTGEHKTQLSSMQSIADPFCEIIRPATLANSQCPPTLVMYQMESYTVGGIHISCVDRRQAVDAFFNFISSKDGGYITVRDAHGIVESQTDSRLRDIINAARMTLPDGMPIVWIGKLKNYSVERVTGVDFVQDITRDPRARHIRHYFYGGRPENTSRIAAWATDLLGRGAIAGWHAPPFRPPGALEDKAVLSQIAAAQPDVIWVGLSTPKQEYWMANHAAHFPHTIFVGIGAAFDFIAGTQRRAPAMIQRLGCEWLFRLIQEPQRLSPRYLRVVPRMLKIMIAEMMHR